MASALAEALDEAGLAAAVAEAQARCEPRRAVALVKPVLPPSAQAEQPPLRYCDPMLIRQLVSRLEKLGTDVRIACHGAAALLAARRIGYDGDLVDITVDPVPFHYGGSIGDHPVGRAWRDADLRIVVGKVRSDAQLLYCGTLVASLACVPESSALGSRFRSAPDIAACANDVVQRLPVAFGVLDAWYSAEHAGRRRAGRAVPTGSVLASQDLLAVDWVLGELMGLDGPELNPVVREAVQRRDPQPIDRRGDLADWAGWSNVAPLPAVIADLRAASPLRSVLGGGGVPWTDR